MLTGVAFWTLAVAAVASGVAVFVVDSMARATYALALSFIAVGIQILLLQQGYLGLITILMMVMEMAVMAIYMVMFMGMNPALMPMDMTHGKKTAIGTSVGAFVLLAGGALLIPWPQRRGAAPDDLTRALGLEIMGEKMLVMSTGRTHEVDKVGVFTPKRKVLPKLGAGEVGWITASIKDVHGAPVGDTLTLAGDPAAVSPIRFHNSVHNAAAGYWTIGTGCLRATTAISAVLSAVALGPKW